MSVQYVKSKKGRDQLLYKGYLHTKERASGNKTFWKCAIYHKDRCPGRAHTCDDRITKYSAHRHPPRKAAREAKRIEGNVKTTTPTVPQLTDKVVPSTSGGLPETVPTKKPRIQNPKQTMQRLRACLGATRKGMYHSQTSAAVAKLMPENPSSVLSVTPPNLHECSERFKDDSFTASPMRCKKPKASCSVHIQASQEARRQRFRSGTVPPGANPQEILSQISEAARQWLCPQEHNKEQIVDMVILEQFLAVLPGHMRVWVKARDPRSSMEALWLAETYLQDQELSMAGQELEKDPVVFKDVSVHFSEEEWALLDQREKALHWNVMHQNYDNVAWLRGGTGRKREKDPWLETSQPVVELLKKSNKEISWDVEQDSIRENHLERKPQSTSEKEDGHLFISGLKEITRNAELGLETVYVCCAGREGEESSSVVASRESPREEDAEIAILSGESSEKKNPQTPEENLIKEDTENVKRAQSNNPRVEENLIPFIKALSGHQDNTPEQETFCMAVDGGDQDESLALLPDQNITIEDNLESVSLPEGSLFISEEEIPQSSDKDSQPEPIDVNSLSESNMTYSGEGMKGTAALINQKTIILDREQISSPEKEGGEAKSILSGNGLTELTEDWLLLHSQLAPEPQPINPNPEESSEHNSSQKSSQEEDLPDGHNNKRQFIQSSAFTTHPTYSDSGKKSESLSVLIKHRRFDKKRKPHETLNTSTEEHRTTWEAASSSDTREAKPQERTLSSSPIDEMAAEPIVAQLMAVLKQVAADTAEIKSAVYRLYPTMAGIQNALGNLSGCTDDAVHRISDLEFTSRNTKAQLVQHGNDIKAIEAKLVGKAVQTNVIAGLWPSLRIKREMSPWCSSPT